MDEEANEARVLLDKQTRDVKRGFRHAGSCVRRFLTSLPKSAQAAKSELNPEVKRVSSRKGAQPLGWYEWGQPVLTCGLFKFPISADFGLHLQKGDTVDVQFHLAEKEYPRKYALRACSTNPTRQIAVSVSGQDTRGPFQVWLCAYKRSKVVSKMNTLVEIVEGYSYEERLEMGLPRRWYTERNSKHYTT